MEDEAESMAKVKDFIDATSLGSDALQTGNEFAFQVLLVALRSYFSIKDTSFNVLKSLYKLETNTALQQSLN